MSFRLHCPFGHLLWPSNLSARLIDGLSETSKDGDMEVELFMLTTEASIRFLEMMLVSPDEVTLDEWDARAVEEAYAALDYLGCWPCIERMWDLMGWTWTIKTLACAPTAEELRARPAFEPSQLPATPWPRDSTYFDPHEDWNILSLVARPDPPDLHLVPGWEHDIRRPVATGLPCGDLTIQPTRRALARAIQERFFEDDRIPREFADLWYDPLRPDRTGFVIAGGAALQVLTWGASLDKVRVNTHYHDDLLSDVDLYFIGPSEEDARNVMLQLHERILWTDLLNGNVPIPFYAGHTTNAPSWVVQTSQAFTFGYGYECNKKVQLITRLFPRLEDLFSSFDYGPCKVAITFRPDGQPQALVAREAAEALQTGILRLDPYRPIQRAYFVRARKYTQKGFGFGLPFPVGWRGTHSTRELLEDLGGIRGVYKVIAKHLAEQDLPNECILGGLRQLLNEWQDTPNRGNMFCVDYSPPDIEVYFPHFPALLVPRDHVSWLGRLIDHMTGFARNSHRTLFEVQYYYMIWSSSAQFEIPHRASTKTIQLPVPAMPGAYEEKPASKSYFTREDVEMALFEMPWLQDTTWFERSTQTAQAFFETPVMKDAPSDPEERLRWILSHSDVLRDLKTWDEDVSGDTEN